MTYPELKIALDIGDPETVLSSLNNPYNPYEFDDKKSYGPYFIVCDDGDVHSFSKDGIEQNIDCIPVRCFSFNASLEKIIIPSTVTDIGCSSFYACLNLKSVVVPDSVETIRSYAFYNCIRLASITISNSATDIEYDAFYGCNRLKSIVFEGKTIRQVRAMDYYPWGIEDTSIIQAGL